MIGTDIYKKHCILIRRGHIGHGGGPGYTLHIPSPGTTLTAAEFRRMILDLVEHLLEIEYRGAAMRPEENQEEDYRKTEAKQAKPTDISERPEIPEPGETFTFLYDECIMSDHCDSDCKTCPYHIASLKKAKAEGMEVAEIL